MPNQQAPLKPNHREDGYLVLHHVFATLQGEGPFAGHPAIFVRLAGCNLQCPACDTEYSMHGPDPEDAGWHRLPARIVSEVTGKVPAKWKNRSLRPLVVITGGEPFRQNIVPLVGELLSCGYPVQIETNGTLWNKDMAVLCGLWPGHLTIVCSPKTGRLHEGILKHCRYYKYILQANQIAQNDGLPNTTMMHAGPVARPPMGATVYVQALDETHAHPRIQSDLKSEWLAEVNAGNLRTATLAAMEHGYRLSVQTHKLAHLE